MPALDSIIQVTPVALTMAGTAGAAGYLVLETNEVDAGDVDNEKPRTLAFTEAAAAIPKGDNYSGKDRKAAKLSKAQAKLEKFDDLKDLIDSLTSDAEMVDLDIPTSSDSDRVEQEQRNVQVKAFMYAASREKDNDFHLIIGRDPKKKEMFMNMELSGLPPDSSDFPAFDALRKARDAYKLFYETVLKHNLPGLSYQFYPNPPIPVLIEGSLFFDATHSHGNRPGPPSLKSRIPTIWEVHPITKITFQT
ncbi:MAG: hypothetical protein ACJ754_27705 [Pyrinomonadaceae bacterium]